MTYYIIIRSDAKSYGRLFNSAEDAEFWREKYGIDGTIEEYKFPEKEEGNGSTTDS